MWHDFKKYIPRAAGKYNFTSTMKAIEVCQAYRKVAREILPATAAKNTFPKAYKNNTLTIGALNSSWAQMVQLHKHRLHKSLRDQLGEKTVAQIKIEIAESMPKTELEAQLHANAPAQPPSQP